MTTQFVKYTVCRVTDLTLVDEREAALAALTPLRATLLGHLEEPASASELSRRLGVPRQKLGYHLGVLERHGLAEVVEERQRRGFVEKRYRRTGRVVLAPDLVQPVTTRDSASAAAVVAAAGDAIRSVGALHAAAEAAGMALPTATLVADVAFASPGAVHEFLADVASLAARYDTPARDSARTLRLTLLAHPTPEENHR